jgi:hypothetical protein
VTAVPVAGVGSPDENSVGIQPVPPAGTDLAQVVSTAGERATAAGGLTAASELDDVLVFAAITRLIAGRKAAHTVSCDREVTQPLWRPVAVLADVE